MPCVSFASEYWVHVFEPFLRSLDSTTAAAVATTTAIAVTNDPSSSATTTTTTATILLSVRDIAQMANLPMCTKPDSISICFIERCNFTKFVSQYLPPTTTTIW